VKALERQAARRRLYSLTAFGGLMVCTIVFILLLLAGWKQKTLKMYRDPLVALRDIFAVQETLYFMHHGRYATLAELEKEGVIETEVVQGPVEGYLYRALVIEPQRFVIAADPSGPAPPGPRGTAPLPRHHFAVDETHTVRYDEAAITSRSPVVWSPREAGGR